jgi:5-methylcytosine-specific restriction endonuclease McrA
MLDLPGGSRSRSVFYRVWAGSNYCIESIRLEIHHITPRPYGSDHPKNLMTLCKECHKGVHVELKVP